MKPNHTSKNWVNHCLNDVCQEITSGGAAPQNKTLFENGTHPFIRVADLGQMTNSEKYVTRIKDKLNNEGIQKLRLFPKGTVLFTKSGASLLLNQRAVLKTQMYVVSHIGCMIPSKIITSDWLFYFMKQIDFAHYAHATTLPSLKISTLKSLIIPIPPPSEQQRIVTRIEELFSELDKAVETLQTIKQQLEMYRQAVLKEAFEGKLTNNIPPKMMILGDFIEQPKYGTSKKCNYTNGDTYTAVIRIPNIDARNGVIDHSDMKYAEFTALELENLSLDEGDLLIIRSNGSVSLVGKAALIRKCDTADTFAGYLMRLRIKDKGNLLPRYLLHYLVSRRARIYIENAAKSTSGVNNINAQEVAKIPIPYVEAAEQALIINEIDSRMSIYENTEKTVDAALMQGKALRQSILKAAFEGRM